MAMRKSVKRDARACDGSRATADYIVCAKEDGDGSARRKSNRVSTASRATLIARNEAYTAKLRSALMRWLTAHGYEDRASIVESFGPLRMLVVRCDAEVARAIEAFGVYELCPADLSMRIPSVARARR